MSHVIYGLFDSRDRLQRIRYVGYTGGGLGRRLWEHVHEAKQGANSYRHNWIRKLLAAGAMPQAKVLEAVTTDNWQARERHWITHFRRWLTNQTEGGEGLINPTAEVRERIRQKVKQVSIFQPGNSFRKGIAHTAADKKKIGDGVRNSEKYKQGILARKENGFTPTAAMEAAARVNRGKPKSPEHRMKISLARKRYFEQRALARTL